MIQPVISRHCLRQTMGLALLPLLLVACGGPPSAIQRGTPAVYNAPAMRTDFAAYEDPDYGYRLALPRAWYAGQLPNPNSGIVVASSNDPSQPRGAITILVEPVGAAAKLDRAIATAEATLRASDGIGSFDIDLARKVTVNGRAGEERIYSYRLEEDEVRQRSFYFVTDERLYAISYIAPKELYARYDTLFADVIASWQTA